MNTDPYRIYVSVGHPHHFDTIQSKVMVGVDHANGQTPVQAAKILRKKIADEMGFKPSELYYEVYGKPEAQVPFAASLNAPFLSMG